MRAMTSFLARRLIVALLLVFVTASGALLLTTLAPGDVTTELVGSGISREALARERARLGLERPALEQYFRWVERVARLDLGTSLRYGRPVREMVFERAGNTALLGITALALATLTGIPLGVIAGANRPRLLSRAIRTGSGLVLSFPPLLTSLLFAFFAARTRLFPVGGMGSTVLESQAWSARLGDLAWYLTLPAIALALPMAATLERLQSRAMAETLKEPYVRGALARGIPEGLLLWRDTLRVAATPVAAMYGIVVATLLSGSFAVEIVMAWPGLGSLTYDALVARDTHLVAGCAVAAAAFLALGTLISDLLLIGLDPRLRERP